MPALDTVLDLAEPVAMLLLFLATIAALIGCVLFGLNIVGVL
jgi:hypothetical protein